MDIVLERLDNAFHLRASNTAGHSVETDASPSIGGNNKAMRPMEMVLASLGSCSTIDVIHFLGKMRQQVSDIKVQIKGERAEDQQPALFTQIHVHFDVYGELSPDKVERAVAMSMEKYCSVARILEKTATITWDFQIHPAAIPTPQH